MREFVPTAAIAVALTVSLAACGGAPGGTPTVAGPSDIHPTSPGGAATPTPTPTPTFLYTDADILATIDITAKATNGAVLQVNSTVYLPETFGSTDTAAIMAVLSAAGDTSNLTDPTWLHDHDADMQVIDVDATHVSGPAWPASSSVYVETGQIGAASGAVTSVGLPTVALSVPTADPFGWALQGSGSGYYVAAYTLHPGGTTDEWWTQPAYFGFRGGDGYTMTACTIHPTPLLTAHDDIWGANGGAFSDPTDRSCEIGFGGE